MKSAVSFISKPEVLLQVGDEKRKYSSYTHIKCAVGLQGMIVSSYEAAVFGKPGKKMHLGLFVCCFSLQDQPEAGWWEREE